MAINLIIAVTDDDWFEMLRRRPDIGEVNFWAPSGASFRALQPGELFLFKLPVPPSWSRNIVSFKSYNTGDAPRPTPGSGRVR
jgi:hypothetical protein